MREPQWHDLFNPFSKLTEGGNYYISYDIDSDQYDDEYPP